MADHKLDELRRIYQNSTASAIVNAQYKEILEQVKLASDKRASPYGGIPTLLGAPYREIDWAAPDLVGLDIALLGVPMDAGATNRSGARFGPRALRAVERIGPYNHALRTAPGFDLRIADIGDIPLPTHYSVEEAHNVIERHMNQIVDAGVVPISVGGDHSIDRPILRAVGKVAPVGLIHIDAHCDTSGGKHSHGGPFRQAVLDGVLDPRRTVQIGIRGPSEYYWEFSYESGMTVIHCEEIDELGVITVIERAREIVGTGPTYLSLDIDALDPSFAPGTGTPEIGGLTTREAQALLRGLKGIHFVGADLVEISPPYDPAGTTALVGAQLLFEILSLFPFSERLST